MLSWSWLSLSKFLLKGTLYRFSLKVAMSACMLSVCLSVCPPPVTSKQSGIEMFGQRGYSLNYSNEKLHFLFLFMLYICYSLASRPPTHKHILPLLIMSFFSDNPFLPLPCSPPIECLVEEAAEPLTSAKCVDKTYLSSQH